MANSLGKLTKHHFMMRSRDLVPALPQTRKMNRQNFILFLTRYRHIIAKPSHGSGGAGVMSIHSLGNGQYRVHYGMSKRTIKGIQATYIFVQRKSKGLYVVQQKINLARIDGKPFDLRVMVQRKKDSSWTVTSILAKIAGSGYFITNLVRSKGRALPLTAAIRRSNISNRRDASIRRIEYQIRRLALKVVDRMQKHYRLNTVGIDMGVDSQGKVWIIE